jgi:hypothetical protein
MYKHFEQNSSLGRRILMHSPPLSALGPSGPRNIDGVTPSRDFSTEQNILRKTSSLCFGDNGHQLRHATTQLELHVLNSLMSTSPTSLFGSKNLNASLALRQPLLMSAELVKSPSGGEELAGALSDRRGPSRSSC